MAVKIEKGGWALIFVIGAGLVAYSLNRYGIVDFSNLFGSRSASSKTAVAIDPSKPLALPALRRAGKEGRARPPQYLGGVRGRPGR